MTDGDTIEYSPALGARDERSKRALVDPRRAARLPGVRLFHSSALAAHLGGAARRRRGRRAQRRLGSARTPRGLVVVPGNGRTRLWAARVVRDRGAGVRRRLRPPGLARASPLRIPRPRDLPRGRRSLRHDQGLGHFSHDRRWGHWLRRWRASVDGGFRRLVHGYWAGASDPDRAAGRPTARTPRARAGRALSDER